MFIYPILIHLRRWINQMKVPKIKSNEHLTGILFSILLIGTIMIIFSVINEILTKEKVQSLFINLRDYLIIFASLTVLYIWEMTISIRLIKRRKGISFIVGLFFLVAVEILYYVFILLYSFVFLVGIWSIYIRSTPIVYMAFFVLIALILVGVIYVLSSKLICLLLPKNQNLYIDYETHKKVGELHKAFGAIVFIMSLSGGLVVGIFLPTYEPTNIEKVVLFSLTMSAIIFYSLTDIINGLFNVNLISEVNKKYSKDNRVKLSKDVL